MMGGGWVFVLVAASLASSGLSVPLRQAAETLCATEENFVRIAALESCIKYFQCYSGRAYLMQCPDFTWFNESEQICDDSDPPQGCESAQPPPPPTPPPEESEGSEESVEEPEEPVEEPEEPIGEPEEPEEPVVEPEEPIEEPEEPVDEPEDSTEDPDLPIGDPSGDPEESEDVDNQEEPTGEQEGNGEEQGIGEPDEGSGDLPNEESITESSENALPAVEEGSGFDAVRAYIIRRLGRSEEDNISGNFHSISFEASGENSQDHDFDLEVDELFQSEIIALPEEDLYEIPSIDPVFVIPDSEENYK